MKDLESGEDSAADTVKTLVNTKIPNLPMFLQHLIQDILTRTLLVKPSITIFRSFG